MHPVAVKLLLSATKLAHFLRLPAFLTVFVLIARFAWFAIGVILQGAA